MEHLGTLKNSRAAFCAGGLHLENHKVGEYRLISDWRSTKWQLMAGFRAFFRRFGSKWQKMSENVRKCHVLGDFLPSQVLPDGHGVLAGLRAEVADDDVLPAGAVDVADRAGDMIG